MLMRVLIVSVVLIGVISALYLEELWSGEHAWKEYQAEAKARGTKLTIAEFIRPPIKDEDNFAAIPLFQDLFDTNKFGTMDPFTFPHASTTNRWLGQPTDFVAWRNKFVEESFYTNVTGNAARDVLEALKVFDADLAQLRAAASRPDCRFPVDYSKGLATLFPQMTPSMHVSRVLRLRMAAELAEGNSSDAYADFKLGLRICRATEHDLSLISGLVRIAMLSELEAAVHEGLVTGRWSPSEISGIQNELAVLNLTADCEFTTQSERAVTNEELDRLFGGRTQLVDFSLLFSGGNLSHIDWPGTLAILMFPRGWVRQNEVVINKFCDAEIARLDVKTGRILAVPTESAIRSGLGCDGPLGKYYYAVANFLLPASDHSFRRYASCQTQTEMAMAACALERFRIARTAYPEKLENLVPEFAPDVPLDPVDGKPLRYERQPDGGFVLWSPDFEHKFATLASTNAPPVATNATEFVSGQIEQWVWRQPAR